MENILKELTCGYEEQLSQQKARIAELSRENYDCLAELDKYRQKDKQISDALKRAEEYSAEIKEKSDMQYALAVKRVSAFLEKWDAYFNHLKEKYPLYPVVNEAVALRDKVVKILGAKTPKTVIYNADKEISALQRGDRPAFNPKEKIADYIAATESDGFNMDEVLHPGALKLEDLCKELGLLTEKD